MKIESPCLLCESREVGCHSRCQLYGTFRKNLDDYNSRLYEAKNKNNELFKYKLKASQKALRKKARGN